MVKIEKEVNGVATQLVAKYMGKKMYDWKVTSFVTPMLPISYMGRTKGLSGAICLALNRASEGIRESVSAIAYE